VTPIGSLPVRRDGTASLWTDREKDRAGLKACSGWKSLRSSMVWRKVTGLVVKFKAVNLRLEKAEVSRSPEDLLDLPLAIVFVLFGVT